jgi:hypothetical protein
MPDAMSSQINDEDQLSPVGKAWPIFSVAWLAVTMLVYGSSHDWKSANILVLPYLPMYLVAWSGLYFLFGFVAKLLCNHWFCSLRWLTWVIILLYGFIPRVGRMYYSLTHWEYRKYDLIIVGIGLGLCVFWSAMGAFCARKKGVDHNRALGLVVSLCVIVSLTDVPFVLDFISTRGAWVQFAGRWESWKHGESLPRGWETQEVDGVRFIL